MGGGVCVVGDVDEPFMPALRFCVLLVLPLPKPWRLKEDIFRQSRESHSRGCEMCHLLRADEAGRPR